LGNLAGSTVQDKFVVISKLNRTTRKRKPYWELVLADSSGQVAGRIWNNFDHAGRAFESGHVLEVAAPVETYAGELQLNIQKFRRLPGSEYELTDFPKGTTGEPDDFAELTKFEVAAGTWVMTDATSQIAFATRQKSEVFVAKYLDPSAKEPILEGKSSKMVTRPSSRGNEDMERTTYLKRKYLRKPEGT
jgi:hypothetical protein